MKSTRSNSEPSRSSIRFVSAEEPYTDSLTLEQAELHDVLLAYELDGKPLSRPHGAPARVVIPPYYPDHEVTRRDWAEYLDAASELDRKVGLILKQLERFVEHLA